MVSIEEYGVALAFTEGARSEVDLAALVETHAALLFRVAHSSCAVALKSLHPGHLHPRYLQ